MHFSTPCNPTPIIWVFISPLMSLQILTFVPRYINVCTCLTCIHRFLRENSLVVFVSLLLFWIYKIIDLFHLPTSRHNSFIHWQYVCYIKILDIFRALTCPSSGKQIVLSQHLVSSLSVNGCTVCRMRADCSAVCSHPAYYTVMYREWRYQMLW